MVWYNLDYILENCAQTIWYIVILISQFGDLISIHYLFNVA